jgi:uncharacterized protein (TIGR03435 family)
MGMHLRPATLQQKHLLRAFLFAGLACSLGAPLRSAESQTPDWQIAAGGRMAFDVATVRRTTNAPSANAVYSNFPLGPGDVYVPNGGQLRAMNFPLIAYIEFAYKITENQEQFLLSQIPKWAITDRFDIQAKAQGNPTKDQMRLMMQTLLADRFKLIVHYEVKQLPILALVMDVPGKLGPLLQQHIDDSPCPTVFRIPSPAPGSPPVTLDRRFPATCGGLLDMAPSVPGRYRTGARNVSMDLIANSIPGGSSGVNIQVLNRTGLTGNFDFALEFTPRHDGASAPPANFNPDTTGPTFMDALRDQLGLKLDAQQGPVEVFVVDYVEEPQLN